MIRPRAFVPRKPVSSYMLLLMTLCTAILSVALLLLASIATPSSADEEAGEHVTVFVVDESGSMTEPHDDGLPASDKDGLRCSAVRMFIDLAGPKDMVGVVFFPGKGEEKQKQAEIVVNPAGPFTKEVNRSDIKSKIVCAGDGGFTPLADGLNKAYDMLSSVITGTNRTGSVVVITDGLPTPERARQWETIQDKLLDFKARGWRIDTIRLMFDSQEFLNINAPDNPNSPGGNAYRAATALDLEPYLLQIYTSQSGRSSTILAPRATVRNDAPYRKTFEIPPLTHRLDLIALKSSESIKVTLYKPGGEPVTNINQDARIASQDAHYAIYSVEEPLSGGWTLEFVGDGEVAAETLVDSQIKFGIKSPNFDQVLASNHPIIIKGSLYDENDRQLTNIQADVQFHVVGQASGEEYRGLMERDGPGDFSAPLPINPDTLQSTYNLTITTKAGDVTLPSISKTFIVRRIPEPALQQSDITALRNDSADLSIIFALNEDPQPWEDVTLKAFDLTAEGPTPLEVTPRDAYFLVKVPSPREGANKIAYRLEGTYWGVNVTGWEGQLDYTVKYNPVLKLDLLPSTGPYAIDEPIAVTAGLYRTLGKPERGIDQDLQVLAIKENDPFAPPIDMSEVKGQEAELVALGNNYIGTFSSGAAGVFTVTARYQGTIGNEEVSALAARLAVIKPFPQPLFEEPERIEITDWGWLGDIFYTSPFPGPLFAPVAEFALPGRPADDGLIRVPGQVLVDEVPYAQGDVIAEVRLPLRGGDGNNSVPMKPEVRKDPQDGRFTVAFKPPRSGAYALSAHWSGDYEGRQSYSGKHRPSETTLAVAIRQPTTIQWLWAGFITLIWSLFLLAMSATLGMFLRYVAAPKPYGWVVRDENQGIYDLRKRNFRDRFFRPSYIPPGELTGLRGTGESTNAALKAWWGFGLSEEPRYFLKARTYILSPDPNQVDGSDTQQPDMSEQNSPLYSDEVTYDINRLDMWKNEFRQLLDNFAMESPLGKLVTPFKLIFWGLLIVMYSLVRGLVNAARWLWERLARLMQRVWRSLKSFIKMHQPWMRQDERDAANLLDYEQQEEALRGTYYPRRPTSADIEQ